MKKERNKLMHFMAGAVILLMVIVNILGRYFHLFDFSHGSGSFVTSYDIEASFGMAQHVLFILPIVFFVLSILLYRRNNNHRYIPYLLTLALTFASIAIISGGSGRVEFHFSIFMVVAAVGYYQKIKLLLMMTVLFAIQHIVGLLFFPELVFGVEHYMFSMFLWHAIFLVLTSSVVSWQVYSGKKIENYYQEKQQEQRKTIIEDIVERLSTTSSQILSVSDTLSSNTKESYQASGQLAASMEEVSASIEQQLEIIQDNRKVITQIDEGIKSINQTAKTVAANSTTSATEAQRGSELIEKLLLQMKEITVDVDESYTNVKELLRRSQSIEGIVEVISDIADQTNLLALNASIESARAGEYGKGFAVVADEVRKLAVQSQESSQNISKIIKQILIETNQSVKSMENVKASTTEGLDTAEKSNKVFHHISKETNEIALQVQSVSSLTDNLSSSSEKVNASMQQITEAAEQSVSGTKEGMSSSDLQHELTEGTVDVSKKLNELTSELEEVIRTLRNEV
ncbi:methyl-accepting chemotaxis protein [Ornithinibacillus salinisoli]|uniref:Methyl-accepting chemotaxis protein n=1 Tax=Ornithinibacillus salinisoli TaxID=1848459 RepID=A0ABW4W039_9BACI